MFTNFAGPSATAIDFHKALDRAGFCCFAIQPSIDLGGDSCLTVQYGDGAEPLIADYGCRQLPTNY